MPGNGEWVSYSGTAEIVLIVVLAAAAAAVAYAGARLPLAARLPRPGRAATITMVAAWVAAIAALLACVAAYETQVARAGLAHTRPANSITPVTLTGVCVVFVVIAVALKASGWRVAVGSAVLGAAAAPWIFEVPFDLIIMARTRPLVDPGLYRPLLFAPLILTGITTVALLSLSPAVRLRRATLWCLAGMLALYAIWALYGFSYPSAPGPVTLNVLSKILALITALTLFLPQRAAAGQAPAPDGNEQARPASPPPTLGSAAFTQVVGAPELASQPGRSGAPAGTWLARRAGPAGVALLAGASLAVSGWASSTSHAGVAGCQATHAAAGTASSAPGGSPNPAVAAGWTLPGADLQNTRDVASAITASNVARLGVAWCVPIESTGVAGAHGLTDGYSTTPVIANGVVYTQDIESNVMAIRLATGKVLWTHDYNSVNGGPDGVNVAGGVVYAATSHAAVALSAATGRQLWSRTLVQNDHEGIDMAPGYHDGTCGR
jgi:hypothetical protein